MPCDVHSSDETSIEVIAMSGAVMANECIVGVFESVPEAQLAAHILDRAGLGKEHLSLVVRHLDASSEVGKELSLGDDSSRNAVIGATLGGLAGVVGDAAIFLVTGLGAIIVAGPILATMGAIVGAFLGGMEGWGIHKVHIHKYEKLVEEGKVLVVVNGDPKQLEEANRILRQTAAIEVELHAASSTDATEIDDRP
jgi:hypothetical protein